MSDTFKVLTARNAGEKDNPRGGKLVKWYLTLADSPAGNAEVYCQKKPGNELSEGMEVYGRLEKGEYGWRLFPESPQDGAQRSFGGMSKDDYWNRRDERDIESQARQGRAHAQEMALRYAELIGTFSSGLNEQELGGDPRVKVPERLLLPLIDWFHQDVQRFPLDADVGGGPGPTGNDAAAADVSAVEVVRELEGGREASAPQKRKLTELFNKAGLAKEAQKAVVLWRCQSEKATKDGASRLIQDLIDGASADSLLAEVWDGKRSGNPLGVRAAALIPSDVPGDTSGLPSGKDL